MDIGDVRIGVAVSDPLGIVASPHTVLDSRSDEKDAQAINDIVEDVEAVRIVAGLPLSLDGQVGHQAQKVLNFLESLRAVVSVEVVTQDERFSTASAERALLEANVRRKARKRVIDKVAAQQILQAYLDRQANERKRTS